jgi:acetyl-CoA carboxylase carboxyltransferase component
MLPSNNLDPPPSTPPRGATTDERPRLAEIVPHEPNKPYDMRSVVAELVDDGDFLELHEDWARNVICVLAHIDGEVVGIIGNQPSVLAGVLDSAASQKAARFVCFNDAFGIPMHPYYATERGLVDDVTDADPIRGRFGIGHAAHQTEAGAATQARQRAFVGCGRVNNVLKRLSARSLLAEIR